MRKTSSRFSTSVASSLVSSAALAQGHVFSPSKGRGHAVATTLPPKCREITSPHHCPRAVWTCTQDERGSGEEQGLVSVKGRAFPQGSTVAIATASFVCTYSEQLPPFGFWWQGYYGGNSEQRNTIQIMQTKENRLLLFGLNVIAQLICLLNGGKL